MMLPTTNSTAALFGEARIEAFRRLAGTGTPRLPIRLARRIEERRDPALRLEPVPAAGR